MGPWGEEGQSHHWKTWKVWEGLVPKAALRGGGSLTSDPGKRKKRGRAAERGNQSVRPSGGTLIGGI